MRDLRDEKQKGGKNSRSIQMCSDGLVKIEVVEELYQIPPGEGVLDVWKPRVYRIMIRLMFCFVSIRVVKCIFW